MKTVELEILIAEHFGVRTHLIIPNVYWGFGLNYEADLVIVTRSKYAYEVELKVSKSDLKADKNKHPRAHNGECFKRLYYAMPRKIYEPELVPERAGVLLVEWREKFTNWHERVYPAHWEASLERKPQQTPAKKLTDSQYLKLLELQAMRVWSLKKKLVKKEDEQ